MKKPYIGRFAPSPTGPLHLGSLATALGSYLDAKVHHGKWLVRIEDIDESRCKAEFAQAILHALRKHGLQWDGTSPHNDVWVQSQRHAVYQDALDRLTTQGLVYPCACTRKELDEANANRAFGENRIYPGTCRHGMPAGRVGRAVRFACPPAPVNWHDHRLGDFADPLSQTSGDFVLKRGDGYWAYHLVVVVDDIASGVSHIVRGEDLADTTARQVALYQAFRAEAPAYWHLPVILAEDGQKLSKQTGAAALNCEQAIENLKTVWAHFGLPALTATHVDAWLQQAVPVWRNYRLG